MAETGKHSQDNDEDGYWRKPVPTEDHRDGGGRHDSGKPEDTERDDNEKRPNPSHCAGRCSIGWPAAVS